MADGFAVLTQLFFPLLFVFMLSAIHVFQIWLQTGVRTFIIASPLLVVCYQLQQSVSFFSALTAAATSSRRIWWCSQSGTCICMQSSTFGSSSVALVFYGCIFTVSLLSGPWLSDMLSCCYSFWWILPLICTDPLSTSLLPPSSLSCSYLWSLYNRWLFQAHLSFSSGLVFGHQY